MQAISKRLKGREMRVEWRNKLLGIMEFYNISFISSCFTFSLASLDIRYMEVTLTSQKFNRFQTHKQRDAPTH